MNPPGPDKKRKLLSEQKAFGMVPGMTQLCERCGEVILELKYDEEKNRTLCNKCLMIQIKNQPADNYVPILSAPRTLCNRCLKRKPMKGAAWCRTCRDKHQRILITELLGKRRTPQEDDYLKRTCSQWQVWKKEFRKKKLITK